MEKKLAPPDSPQKPGQVEQFRMYVTDTATYSWAAVLAFVLRSDAMVRAGLSTAVDRVSALLQRLFNISVVVGKKALIGLTVAMVVLAVVAVVTTMCLSTAVATSVAVRHFTLTNVPGSRVIPLAFNMMAVYTERWRTAPLDEAIAPAGRHQHQHQPIAGPSAAASPVVDDWTGTEMGEEHTRHSAPLVVGTASPVETRIAHLRLDMLSSLVHSVVASSTLHFPSTRPGDVFLPDGSANYDSIFNSGDPLFNAQGEYRGTVQLVFRREEVGRDVSVVLESSMLFAEDPKVPLPLGALDVLFTTTQTVHFASGVKPVWWPIQTAQTALRLAFIVPVMLYETVAYYFVSSADAPFPSVDPEREVSVVVDVYKKFVPPVALQPRLRAMNFTLYQYNDDDRGVHTSSRLKVKPARITFYSTVKLSGWAYLFSEYPILSFVGLTSVFFSLYMFFSILAILLLSWLGYQMIQSSEVTKTYSGIYKDDSDDEDSELSISLSRQNSARVRRHTAALPRLHLSGSITSPLTPFNEQPPRPFSARTPRSTPFSSSSMRRRRGVGNTARRSSSDDESHDF